MSVFAADRHDAEVNSGIVVRVFGELCDNATITFSAVL